MNFRVVKTVYSRRIAVASLFMLLLIFMNMEGVSLEIKAPEMSNSTVNCTVYQENLANAISSFTSCSVLYSRPIKFCEACVNVYINVLNSYKNLSEFRDEDGPCIDNYVNHDRLEIVKTLYSNSYDLWNRAKCYECFQIKDGKLTNNFSVETNTFNDLLVNVTDCINKTGANATTLCPTCMDAYVNLNNYYISISNENEKIGVCMDIVDLMNGTRAIWSAKCCKFRHKDEKIFIISSIGVIIITLTFYMLTKLCSEKKTPIILKQSRFVGSLSQVFNNS